MNTDSSHVELTASQMINNQIAGLPDWRGEALAQLRAIILDAAPGITEEWKWDTAVWTMKGNVVAVGVFKDHVKLNFFKGAFLEDKSKLFNAGLEAKASRGIDFSEGAVIDGYGLKDLIRSAVAYNLSSSKQK